MSLRPALVAPWPLSLTAPAALLCGGLMAWALAPRAMPGLQLLALAGLLLLIAAGRAGIGRSAGLGLLAGTGWMAGSFWWLYVSMHDYGGLAAPLAVLAVLALAAALALLVAAAMALWRALRSGRTGVDVAWLAALWLAIELARGEWFTGFPWGASGYAHTDGLLAVLAPWIGVYGVGAVAAALSAWFALELSARLSGRRDRWLALSLATLTLAGAGWLPALRGPDFTQAGERLSVTLLQGNVSQDEKFNAERLPEALDWHLRTLLAARTDLVVAPETAIPLLPDQLPDGLWHQFTEQVGASGQHVLVGLPLGDFEHGYTNSVAGLGPTGTPVYRYDKHHLVPFGEFVPRGFRWFVDAMHIPLGDFSRGPLVAPPFRVRGVAVAPNICYEDLFGEELAARFVGAPADVPGVLANVSNIAWFGRSVAVPQHLQISRMRTLELQRPMLRATNTGATVVIDHRGEVRHALPPHERGVLVGEVESRSGLTPYAAWVGRTGLWPAWLFALGMMLWRVRRTSGSDQVRHALT
ncbi:apolipoprotein N-acyltransferase [Leptothrix discophora]|uniref:Apolipoprotein N-acyltransferase n=1 Tax=Leptothrix discophora TaxID=89 RepID=A0ABT9G7M5_LEPDI|nr:apolipoprotein N-acyltransferase [Leptothrix discophora]MDP4302503.1 apolipoprotein N-acyltransferase [Leptothrix discophora]